MTKHENVLFLRSKGWRQMSNTGAHRWQARDKSLATLSGAVIVQLMRDLESE